MIYSDGLDYDDDQGAKTYVVVINSPSLLLLRLRA